MEGENFVDLGTEDRVHDDHDTVISRSPDSLPSKVEIALSKYADSIEGLVAGCGPEPDRYTRGFIAGLRAGEKVAATAIRG